MPRHLHFTKYFIASLALHALIVLGVLLIKPTATQLPLVLPVRIVNLPQQTEKKLPPVNKAAPVAPERPLLSSRPPQRDITTHKSFDKSEMLRLPQTAPFPKAGEGTGGAGSGKPEHGAADLGINKGGPLPFLSQEDVNRLAQKGHTEDPLSNDMLSQETESFKLLPYGRALFAKLNKNMRYPELAAVSGLQGDVYILFEIKKDGSLGFIEVVKSTGYKILDDEVIRTIRESAPFQAFPPDFNKERLIIPAVGQYRIYEKSIR